MNRSVCQEEVFREVYDTYADKLYSFLYYKSGDPSISQDLVQEAFTRLWQNCAKVALDTVKGYVFRTAQNLMLNTFSRKKVRLRFESTIMDKRDNESPEFILEEKELKERLELAISNLPEKQREVFLMSRIDKMTYGEIADLLGISKKAVEKRMYNALDALRKVSSKIR